MNFDNVSVNELKLFEYLEKEHEKERSKEINDEINKGKVVHPYHKSRRKNFVVEHNQDPGFIKSYTKKEREQYQAMTYIKKVKLDDRLKSRQLLFEALLHWDDIRRYMMQAGIRSVTNETKFNSRVCAQYLELRFEPCRVIRRQNTSPQLPIIYRTLSTRGLLKRSNYKGIHQYALAEGIRDYTKRQLWSVVSTKPMIDYDVENLVPYYSAYAKTEKIKIPQIEEPQHDTVTVPEPPEQKNIYVPPAPDEIWKGTWVKPVNEMKPIKPQSDPTDIKQRSYVDLKHIRTETLLLELKRRGYNFTITF